MPADRLSLPGCGIDPVAARRSGTALARSRREPWTCRGSSISTRDARNCTSTAVSASRFVLDSNLGLGKSIRSASTRSKSRAPMECGFGSRLRGRCRERPVRPDRATLRGGPPDSRQFRRPAVECHAIGLSGHPPRRLSPACCGPGADAESVTAGSVGSLFDAGVFREPARSPGLCRGRCRGLGRRPIVRDRIRSPAST